MGKGVVMKDLIIDKARHFLGNDGDDIVVFCQSSSIRFLAETTLIQGGRNVYLRRRTVHTIVCISRIAQKRRVVPPSVLFVEREKPGDLRTTHWPGRVHCIGEKDDDLPSTRSFDGRL